jgi:hypothetical protein
MKTFLLVPLLLAAVGCSPENAGPPARETTANANAPGADQPTSAAKPADDCTAGSGYAYLPTGVHFAFKHHLRSDRYVANRQGGSHRRVILEYLEGDAVAIGAQAKAAMVEAGFRHIDDAGAPNGGTRSRFHRKGHGMAVMTVFPDAGTTPTAPGAIGVVTVEFSS